MWFTKPQPPPAAPDPDLEDNPAPPPRYTSWHKVVGIQFGALILDIPFPILMALTLWRFYWCCKRVLKEVILLFLFFFFFFSFFYFILLFFFSSLGFFAFLILHFSLGISGAAFFSPIFLGIFRSTFFAPFFSFGFSHGLCFIR